jgi:hypothetical protein
MLLLKCQRCAIGDDHDVQDRGFFYSDFRNLKKHMIGDGTSSVDTFRVPNFITDLKFVDLTRKIVLQWKATKTVFSGRIKTRLLHPGKPFLIRVANLPRP